MVTQIHASPFISIGPVVWVYAYHRARGAVDDSRFLVSVLIGDLFVRTFICVCVRFIELALETVSSAPIETAEETEFGVERLGKLYSFRTFWDLSTLEFAYLVANPIREKNLGAFDWCEWVCVSVDEWTLPSNKWESALIKF